MQICRCVWALRAEPKRCGKLTAPQRHTSHAGQQHRGTVQKVAQPFGVGNHPLTHRNFGKQVLDQMCGQGRHPSRGARGTHASSLAGKGNQEIMAAAWAAGASEAVGENAAGEIGTQLPLDSRRNRFAVRIRIAPLGQPSPQVLLHQSIQHRALGTAALIAARRCAASGGSGGHLSMRSGTATTMPATLLA